MFDFVEQQAAEHGMAAEKQPTSKKKNPAGAPSSPPATPQSQEQIFSVTEISTHIRQVVEGTFGHVMVEGEVGSLRLPSSGHVYFNLKDEQNTLKAVVWRSAAARLKFAVEDGLKVVAHGRITTYAPRSDYQMVIDRMEIAGEGDLMRLLEERKQKLAAEGLFDENRKRPLPALPQTIGVVTSPTGAVIQDILHRVAARLPVHVVVWPVRVQGEGAAEEITAAVNGFNALADDHPQRPDVLIVARGGGSLEDLWPFNEENVVRAVAESGIPTLSGVGHEPDVTLVDYAADKRAPTPTAAAEMAVPVRQDLLTTLHMHQARLSRAINTKLATATESLKFYKRMLPTPTAVLAQAQMRVEERRERLEMAMQNQLKKEKQKITHMAQLLASVSPEAPLKRGYVYVTAEDGSVVKSAETSANKIKLTFHDGTRQAILD